MSNHQFSLDGRVALVTGATSGIGWAIAVALRDAGATVVLNGRDPEKLELSLAKMPGAISASFDITDYDAVHRGLDQIVASLGRLDVVVCNAAIRDRREFSKIDPNAYRRVLEVNTVSPFELARSAVERMPDARGGRLIFISSTGAKRPFKGDPIYASSKAAVESLVRSLAYELRGKGITVNAIAPGFTSTDYNQSMLDDPAVSAFVIQRVPAQRWGRPDEIGAAAVFLASDAAAYINGHVLTVDGGLSAIL